MLDETSAPGVRDEGAEPRPYIGRGIIISAALTLAVCTILGIILPGFHTLREDEIPAGVTNLLDERIREFHRSDPITPVIRLLMTIREPNPGARTVSLLVSARFFDPGVPTQPTFVDREGKPIIDPETGSIEAAYAAAAIEVLLNVPFSGKVSVPFKMKDIETASTNDLTAVVDLPSDAYPQSFPNDSYQFDTYVHVFLPSGISAVVASGSVPRPIDYRVAAGFAPDHALVDWHLTTPALAVTQPDPDYGYLVTLVPGYMRRPIPYDFFVYGVALTPLLLGLSFAVHQMNWRRHGISNTTAGIEIAAALLALLALRQVLVPGNINGITLLDKILGLEMVVFSSLAAIMFTKSAPLPSSKLSSEALPTEAGQGSFNSAPTGPVRPRLRWSPLTLTIAAWVGIRALRHSRKGR